MPLPATWVFNLAAVLWALAWIAAGYRAARGQRVGGRETATLAVIAVLMAIGGFTLQERLSGRHAAVIRRTVEMRNPAVEPLNKVQVALLEAWDAMGEEEQTPAWRDAILLSITGIAAAMQSTG